VPIRKQNLIMLRNKAFELKNDTHTPWTSVKRARVEDFTKT
jgi:hypothetical protein